MSEPANRPPRYRVSYSEYVRNQLRELIARARDPALARQALAAAREIDERFHVYPQFGQPLRDLELKPAQLWIGIVPPLVVRYVLDEERLLVMVLNPFEPLSGSGLEP
jgi:hypothetical protein